MDISIESLVKIIISILAVIFGGITIRYVVRKNKVVQKSKGDNSPNVLGNDNNINNG